MSVFVISRISPEKILVKIRAWNLRVTNDFSGDSFDSDRKLSSASKQDQVLNLFVGTTGKGKTLWEIAKGAVEIEGMSEQEGRAKEQPVREPEEEDSDVPNTPGTELREGHGECLVQF